MINSSCKMAINRCHLPSSSTTTVPYCEVKLVLSQQHSKASGFNSMHRLAQCQKYALLFLAVFFLLAVIIALSLDRLSLANLRPSALLWSSSSSSSADLPPKSPTFPPSASPSDDELTSLRDSISHIRRQKAELLSWLNGSEFHQQQHQQTPLDLLVSGAESSGGGLGIFWSPTVEALLEEEEEKLINFEDHETFASSLRNATVIRTEATGCGRSPNRLALLADGRRLCLRYRTNSDQIQGEYASYLLARALGFARRNLPPTVLLTFDPSSSLSSSNLNWAPAVAAELVTTTTGSNSARWTPLKQIVATAFVEHLTPAYIPRQFQQQQQAKSVKTSISESSNNPRLHPLPADLAALRGAKPVNLLQLAQWSDLLLFDYLTANVDRLVNNRVNAQWNEQSMRSAPVHNLLRQEEDQLKGSRLLFLDNESGLYHGYRLLGRFEGHHRALLASLCIFRRGTVQRLKELHQLGESGLGQALLSGDQLQAEKFEKDSKFSLLPRANLSILRRRMGTLLQQVASCQRQFS